MPVWGADPSAETERMPPGIPLGPNVAPLMAVVLMTPFLSRVNAFSASSSLQTYIHLSCDAGFQVTGEPWICALVALNSCLICGLVHELFGRVGWPWHVNCWPSCTTSDAPGAW